MAAYHRNGWQGLRRIIQTLLPLSNSLRIPAIWAGLNVPFFICYVFYKLNFFVYLQNVLFLGKLTQPSAKVQNHFRWFSGKWWKAAKTPQRKFLTCVTTGFFMLTMWKESTQRNCHRTTNTTRISTPLESATGWWKNGKIAPTFRTMPSMPVMCHLIDTVKIPNPTEVFQSRTVLLNVVSRAGALNWPCTQTEPAQQISKSSLRQQRLQPGGTGCRNGSCLPLRNLRHRKRNNRQLVRPTSKAGCRNSKTTKSLYCRRPVMPSWLPTTYLESTRTKLPKRLFRMIQNRNLLHKTFEF